MRLNECEQIIGDVCILVPYCRRHVPKYHRWMQDPELLADTFSEPLTMEEELDMQRLWREDPEKLTFIVLDKQTYQETGGQEITAMAGDINAFICPEMALDQEQDANLDDGISEQQQDGKGDRHAQGGCHQEENPPGEQRCFELSVMIAERTFRRRGIAREATTLMIHYILERIGDARFVAKIGVNNQASIALFQEELKFRRGNFSTAFQLITFELSNAGARRLIERDGGTTGSGQLRIQPYEDQEEEEFDGMENGVDGEIMEDGEEQEEEPKDYW